MSRPLYVFQQNFESKYSEVEIQQWLRVNQWQGIYMTVGFIMMLFLGPKIMSQIKGFQMKKLLLLWNILLAVFSFISTVRLAEFLFRDLFIGRLPFNSARLTDSLCQSKLDNVAAFWLLMFTLSKVAEFGDTLFLILRKRSITVLHGFHHATVLGLCWYSLMTGLPVCKYFAFINVLVHTIMYSYYAAQIAGIKSPKIVSMGITSMQMIQMIIDVGLNAVTFSLMLNNSSCYNDKFGLFISFFLPTSYLILFAQFFIQVYFPTDKKSAKSS